MGKIKGQAWGFDLMVAVMVFLMGVVFFYFYSVNYASDSELASTSLREESELIASSLMSKGFPENWGENNVVRIGIVDEGRINQSKLDSFYSLTTNNYAKTKGIFNVRDDYFINFSSGVNVGGGQVNVIGFEPSASENLIKTSRVVIYDDKIITMEVFVWN